MTVWIGTSGWQYAHWRELFYPHGLPQRLWLEHFAEHFATVEVNNAFYRLPDRAVFEGWRDRTPDDFLVAVKASRYLTHIKRLQDPAEPVARLMDRAAGLGAKLGPVLLQLPPNLPADVDRLTTTLACFPPGVRVAVEPRHPSWWTDDVRDALTDHGAALCWADRGGRPVTPLWRTADWGYLRLHEGRATPIPYYGRAALRSWATRILQSYEPAADVYVYFNNDPLGAALAGAVDLAHLLAGANRSVSRVNDVRSNALRI